MRKSMLIEGLVILGIASAGIIEAMYLITHKEPYTFDEMVGPGSFILFLAVPLLITGLSYIIKNYKKKSSKIEPGFKKQINAKVFGIVLITAMYIYLIGVIGYFLSTIIFFIFAFKFSGVDNWKVNFIVTFVISSCYYIIFVKFSDMVFPKTIFLGF